MNLQNTLKRPQKVTTCELSGLLFFGVFFFLPPSHRLAAEHFARLNGSLSCFRVRILKRSRAREGLASGGGWGGGAVTFEGEQSPFQRAERRGLVPAADLLQEAVGVMAPQRTREAVDPRRQLPTTHTGGRGGASVKTQASGLILTAEATAAPGAFQFGAPANGTTSQSPHFD